MSVSDWGDIIRRQGEEARNKQDQLLEELKEGAGEFRHRLAEMQPVEQLAWFEQIVWNTGKTDPREAEIWQQHLDYLKKLLEEKLS